MIDDGETGLIVPGSDPAALAEAMARLIGDEGLREWMGAKALERSRRFTREEIVPRLEDFYYETVDLYRTRA